jgi:hypothetical protein
LITTSAAIDDPNLLGGAFVGESWSTWRAVLRVAEGLPLDDNHPLLPRAVIDQALERDPEAAAAEWLAEWRSDLADFVNREVIDAVTIPGRYELPPIADAHYSAFVDPLGGSSDSMTMAIGHTEKDGRAVLDVVRDRHPPFSPAAVVAEFAALLREYRVTTVSGDRYAGEWPREQFRQHSITYTPANRPKSDFYRDVRALLNSGRVELLDHSRLAAQFLGLERRKVRSGRDSIDHAPGAHDDLANSVAGVLVQLASRLRFPAGEFSNTTGWKPKS